MSRTPLLRLVAAVLLAGASYGERVDIPVAPSIDAAEESVAPSAAPTLLGPIAPAGRKNWNREAERAAVTPRSEDAVLPKAEGRR